MEGRNFLYVFNRNAYSEFTKRHTQECSQWYIPNIANLELSKFPPETERINKLWLNHTMEYLIAMGLNKYNYIE